jgi:hypothetical protein
VIDELPLCTENWVTSIAMNDQFIAVGHVPQDPARSRVIVVDYQRNPPKVQKIEAQGNLFHSLLFSKPNFSDFSIMLSDFPSDPNIIIGVSVALGLWDSSTILFVGARNAGAFLSFLTLFSIMSDTNTNELLSFYS